MLGWRWPQERGRSYLLQSGIQTLELWHVQTMVLILIQAQCDIKQPITSDHYCPDAAGPATCADGESPPGREIIMK